MDVGNHQGVGFVPSDDMGFVGADDALEELLQDQALGISGTLQWKG